MGGSDRVRVESIRFGLKMGLVNLFAGRVGSSCWVKPTSIFHMI